jgi:transcriptional regulator
MARDTSDGLLRGTMDLLILEILADAPNYGYAIVQRVLKRTRDALDLKEGSLYPALHRLEQRRCLASYWVRTDEGRERKYYRITAAGARELRRRRRSWERFSAALRAILGGGHGRA